MAIADFFLAPIYVPQALWVAARASRLPEAAGARKGEIGQGPPLRVLVLGDSSAAGVGVAHQTDALGGRLARELTPGFSVRWRVVAKSGGTTQSTLAMIRAMAPETVDFVLIALGVNDVKNGVTLAAWTRRYNALLDEIRERFDDPQICLSGLPRVRDFPILPRPLNGVLGARAESFDDRLRHIASKRPRAMHLPLDFGMETSEMADDGFHPGPEVYAEWARRAAMLLRHPRA